MKKETPPLSEWEAKNLQPSVTCYSKHVEDKKVIVFFYNQEKWNIIMLQTTKSQVWTQPARRVCPTQFRAINKRGHCQVACGKWNPWQSSRPVDNSGTYPDLQSPPTVLEKDTRTWTSGPSPFPLLGASLAPGVWQGIRSSFSRSLTP